MTRLFVFLLLALCFVHPAWADIDQRCLKLCKNDGGSSAMCLSQCTYGNVSIGTSRMILEPVENAHRVFNAPKPSEQLLLPSSTSSLRPEASRDYQCINQCLKDGGQYQLCSDRCLRNTCAPGSFRCKDIRGIAPERVLPEQTAPISTALPGSNKGYQPAPIQ